MKGKKLLLLLLISAIFCGSFAACDLGAEAINPVDYSARTDSAEYPADGTVCYTGKQTVSKLGKSANGKKYFEVDGKPFLYLGAQLRTDFFLQLDNYSLDDLDFLFRTAAKLNITCIQVPVCWSDVETSENVYSSAYIDKIMELCNKYSLKLEILWFGSYMCTYTVADDGNADDNKHGYVPNYIYADQSTYPSLGYDKSGNKFDFTGWLGRQYLLMPNVPTLLERESAALRYLMQAVYNYDSTHGGRHTLIGVQIENEADGMIYWRFAEFNLEKTYEGVKNIIPEKITADGLADYCYGEMLEHIDALGAVVKNSDYNCITRHNCTTQFNWEERIEDFALLENIDFVGVDPYNDNVGDMQNYVKKLNALQGNFPHIAENGGEFFNNDLLQLTSFAAGGGYSVFEVVCTSNEALKDWELRGVFKDLGNCRFTQKEQAQYLIDANRAIKDGHAVISNHDDMKVLNGMTSAGLKENKSTGTINGFSYVCETKDRGVGYVVKKDDYVYFSSTKADNFTFTADNYDKTKIEVGYFDSKNVWHTEQEISCKSGKLTLAPARCYRIKEMK